MKPTILHSLLVFALAGVLGGSLASCSSSTEVAQVGTLGTTTSINFGDVGVGQCKDTVIQLKNTGNASLDITSNAMSGVGIDTNFAHTVTLAAGATQNIHIQFCPTAKGMQMAMDTLHTKSGTTVGTTVIMLQGNGVQTLPAPGSSYTFDYYAVDTNGVSGPHSDSTFTVVSNNLTFNGKTEVVQVQDVNGASHYYHQEANGDLSTYVDFSNSGTPIPLTNAWFVVPIGSKVSAVDTLFYQTGVTIPQSPIPVDILVTATGSYSGADNVSVGAKTLSAQKGALRVVFNISAAGGLISFNQIQTTTVSYAPEISFYARRVDETQNIGSKKKGTDNYTLKAYTLK